jgi:hypothetical protein
MLARRGSEGRRNNFHDGGGNPGLLIIKPGLAYIKGAGNVWQRRKLMIF